MPSRARRKPAGALFLIGGVQPPGKWSEIRITDFPPSPEEQRPPSSDLSNPADGDIIPSSYDFLWSSFHETQYDLALCLEGYLLRSSHHHGTSTWSFFVPGTYRFGLGRLGCPPRSAPVVFGSSKPPTMSGSCKFFLLETPSSLQSIGSKPSSFR